MYTEIKDNGMRFQNIFYYTFLELMRRFLSTLYDSLAQTYSEILIDTMD
jgi:hypothetical protein